MKYIGRYEVLGLLGRGGMGSVYKVRLPELGKILALKLLAPRTELVAFLGSEEIHRRFINEARTMGRIRHPNIADVFDLHDDQDATFFIMDYHCRNLGSLIGETYDLEAPTRILPATKAVRFSIQTLQGLARLHHAGIIHRDIKPYNLLLTDDDVVKLTDFGLSLLRGEASVGSYRLHIGSPYYTAPEQENDPDSTGPAADLYSVGVTLYRLLYGRLPQVQDLESSSHFPTVSQHWKAFFIKALAINPDKRYGTSSEMINDLIRLADHDVALNQAACPLNPARPLDSLSGFGKAAAGHIPRVRPIKVSPRQAAKEFGLDNLGRPLTYQALNFETFARDMVQDNNTGLVWRTCGSEFAVTWEEANNYVTTLNLERTNGFSDWRLPTVDEAITILTPFVKAGIPCTDARLNPGEQAIWTADRRSAVASWYVYPDMGFIAWQDNTCACHARVVRSTLIHRP
jgi:serine/threonine protein kinase